jgi:hypothetical protein
MSATEETKGNPETGKPNDSLGRKILLPVTFKVKDKEFRASKDVLISASTYFEKMFTNGMKESSSDVILIQEEPETFQILMDFLHFKIPFITTSNVEVLCYYADKYQIENLKVQCEGFLLRNDSFDSVKERLRISNKFRYSKPLQQYMDQYPTSDPDLSLKGEFRKEALLYLLEYFVNCCSQANSKIESLVQSSRYYNRYNSSRMYSLEEIKSIQECLK